MVKNGIKCHLSWTEIMCLYKPLPHSKRSESKSIKSRRAGTSLPWGFQDIATVLFDTQLLLIIFGCMPEVSKNSYSHCIQYIQVNTLNQNNP